MNIAVWPFLVGGNRKLGYQVIVSPQFLSDTAQSYLLFRVTGGDDSPPGSATAREIRGSRVGTITVVFRVVRAQAQEYNIEGNDVLKDRVGRPIRLFEGIVVQGGMEQIKNILLTQGDFQAVHEQVKKAYKVFWAADESFSAWTSQSLALKAPANAADQITLKAEAPLEVSHMSETGGDVRPTIRISDYTPSRNDRSLTSDFDSHSKKQLIQDTQKNKSASIVSPRRISMGPDQTLQSRWRIVLFILIAVVVLGGGGGYVASWYLYSCHSGICVTNTGGESIGISDGSYAFDTTLPDGSLKSQAAQAYSQNNINQAQSLLNQAIAMNSNDAEALIYQEDLSVLNSHRPYVTIVVGTMLSGSNLTVGRDDLQGAYVAQREFNDGSKLHGGVQVRLLIANAGSKTDYVSNITQQIVQLDLADKTFVGVMGWPFSSYTIPAINALTSAQIPLVSQAASYDRLTDASPYFFRVVPPNKQQGILGAQYAINILHAKNVALFADPNDPYSGSLAPDFLQEFQKEGGQLAVEEKYTVGQPGTLPSELQDALEKKPDLIYFSGHANDLSTLLSNQLPPNLPVLGGDALNDLGEYSSSARASGGFSHLHFTTFAYPDEWDILGYGGQKPTFFSEYPAYFDPNSQHPQGIYGFTRADSSVMLSYDTTLAILNGCNIALSSGKQSVTPEDLELALRELNGANAVQGVSGQIAFGSNGDPISKALVLLYVDPQEYIHMDPTILGQFLKQ